MVTMQASKLGMSKPLKTSMFVQLAHMADVYLGAISFMMSSFLSTARTSSPMFMRISPRVCPNFPRPIKRKDFMVHLRKAPGEGAGLQLGV